MGAATAHQLPKPQLAEAIIKRSCSIFVDYDMTQNYDG